MFIDGKARNMPTISHCIQRILSMGTWNLNAIFKILAFSHSNGSIHARRWRHLAYVNTSYPMSANIGIHTLDVARNTKIHTLDIALSVICRW